MAYGSVRLIPGINVERTPTLNEAGYSQSSLIRWRDGLAQKLGGWVKFFNFVFAGTPRWQHAFQDLNNNDYLAVGTTTTMGVIVNNTLTTLTPQTTTTNPAVSFSTTLGSPIVTVTDASLTSTTTIYDSVFFGTPISVGGLILTGIYPITLPTGTTTYTITAAANATANVTNGGAVPTLQTTSGSASVTVGLNNNGLSPGDSFVFPISTTIGGVTIAGEVTVVTSATNSFTITVSNTASSSAGPTSINSGNAQLTYYIAFGPSAFGAGYGLGTYGTGGYGTGTVPSNLAGTPISATDWSFTNWGQILIGNPENGGIYRWQPGSGFGTLQLIPNAPLYNSGIVLSQPARILMAWGSTIAQQLTQTPRQVGLTQDPLLINWCDQDNFSTWTTSTTNQAGFFRIPTGSSIIGGLQAPHQTLFWTNLELWSATYIGFPLVFNFQQIGSSCGLIGKHAAVVFRGFVYWMGANNFFVYDGSGVSVMPCTVWDQVFQNINTSYLQRCWAWSNTPYNEIWFFYPSAQSSSGECNSYVKFNVVERSWDYGLLPRACGTDQSVLGSPIALTPSGIVYQHEQGFDADGQPMAWSYTTGYFRIAEGEDIAFMDKIIPDMKYQTVGGASTPATITIQPNAVYFPGGPVTNYGPYTFNSSTTDIDCRVRGALVSFTISGNDQNTFSRLGYIRYRYSIDGRR